MKTKKTVLVAGGSGFIGSWLCQDLLKKRFNVICADNEITGKRNNLKEFEKDGSFSFIHQDITKQVDIDSVDFIFHMASPASPVHYQKYPVETLMANSVGTLNLLNLAKKITPKSFTRHLPRYTWIQKNIRRKK